MDPPWKRLRNGYPLTEKSILPTIPIEPQGSSTARMSKIRPGETSNLEKRDEDQQESQDTKQPIPTIHEENSLEKKFYRHFQNSPMKIIMAPPLIIFLQPQTAIHSLSYPSARSRIQPAPMVDTAQHYCWIQSTQYPRNTSLPSAKDKDSY